MVTGIDDRVHGIPVRIRYDGDRYFVADEVVDLYGVGSTLDEARQDYWTAAEECYAELSANADRLAAPLKAQLSHLQDIFGATSSWTPSPAR
jgi:hypothetical protein